MVLPSFSVICLLRILKHKSIQIPFACFSDSGQSSTHLETPLHLQSDLLLRLSTVSQMLVFPPATTSVSVIYLFVCSFSLNQRTEHFIFGFAVVFPTLAPANAAGWCPLPFMTLVFLKMHATCDQDLAWGWAWRSVNVCGVHGWPLLMEENRILNKIPALLTHNYKYTVREREILTQFQNCIFPILKMLIFT